MMALQPQRDLHWVQKAGMWLASVISFPNVAQDRVDLSCSNSIVQKQTIAASQNTVTLGSVLPFAALHPDVR